MQSNFDSLIRPVSRKTETLWPVVVVWEASRQVEDTAIVLHLYVCSWYRPQRLYTPFVGVGHVYSSVRPLVKLGQCFEHHPPTEMASYLAFSKDGLRI